MLGAGLDWRSEGLLAKAILWGAAFYFLILAITVGIPIAIGIYTQLLTPMLWPRH
jgi:hypothetical protein